MCVCVCVRALDGMKDCEHVFELYYDGALLAFKLGEFQESHDLVTRALGAYPEHTEHRAADAAQGALHHAVIPWEVKSDGWLAV